MGELLLSSCGGLKSPSGPEVILADGQTDEQSTGFKEVRLQ